MRVPAFSALSLVLLSSLAQGQSSRFIVDDDAFDDKVTASASRLMQSGKLLSQDALRKEVQTKGVALKLAAPAQHRLDPADLFENLRRSTLAVGTFYKCPDCGEWHFNSSAGFVAAEGGIICTCCHVIADTDEPVKQAYVIAADSEGNVFPVNSVVAADTESDTCLLRVDAGGLKPLPLRVGARTGERIYCLSHPGGYYFMFTGGMIARLNRRPNDLLQDHEASSARTTRPVLFLNVTTEFAPGSSGAPIVDEAGNVLGQVASIADAGDPEPGDDHTAASPSVPIRFCTAAEEILRLTDPKLTKSEPQAGQPKREEAKPKIHKLRRGHHPCQWPATSLNKTNSEGAKARRAP